MASEQRSHVIFPEGSSMINMKHVLIMHSSYPLMIPTSLHTLVGKLQGSTVRSWGVSAGNSQMGMRLQPMPWHRRSCQISCDQWDLKPMSGSSAFGVWMAEKGVNEFAEFDRTRKVTLPSGQMQGQKGNPWSHINRRESIGGIQISRLLQNQSHFWHFSEAVCTDFWKLKSEKWLLQKKRSKNRKSTVLVHERHQTSLTGAHGITMRTMFLSSCCSQWCRI